jgi:sugar lactone lactonase YvrE
VQFDVRGKDSFQRSFVGIAFHGASDSRYEVLYLRPFNFRAEDPIRRSHAVQYAVHPDFTWSKLRSERPGEFEGGVGGVLDPNAWVHLRVEVTADRVRAYVGEMKPAPLDVPCLGKQSKGLVGLWVGEGSGGDFANLRIESLQERSKVEFPVTPEVFIDRFQGAEGITFNGEGRLFIGANNAIWIAEPDGAVRKIADVHVPLGQAGIGPRDILAADFGPKNVFEHGPNDDGIVWRITPEGKKTVVASGIADPNVVLVLPDRTLLVSDDGTDKIYRVKKGSVSVWSTAVQYPNGMALSLDDRVLYVAQIFSSLKPIVGDDRIWAFRLVNGSPAGPPSVVARTGEGGLDGLVADELGRIYVADNGAGKIRRFDPKTGEMILIAKGMPGVASLVFGEGKFDREAIYATSTRSGKIWKVRVGVKGARVHR